MTADGDENFSRELKEVFVDNENSPIQDLVYRAMAFIDELTDFPKDGTTKQQLKFVSEKFREGDLELEPVSEGKKDNLKARKCLERHEWNSALRLAEEGTRVMVDAFVRRGEAAAAAGRHGDAVENFDCALEQCEEEEESEETRFKVCHKMAQAHAKMKNFSCAVKALEKSITYLESLDTIEPKAKAQFLKQLHQTVEKQRKKEDAGDVAHSEIKLDSLVETPRKDLPTISSLVETRENERQGRYSVAAKDIPCGTVISVDRPITSLLNPDDPSSMFQFCANCLHPCEAVSVPCHSCSAVIFCSRRCRNEASKVHRMECASHMYARRQTETSDSFRIFLSLKILLEMDPDELLSGTVIDDRFRQIFAMVTHHTVKTGDIRNKYLVLAHILSEQLKCTGYFGPTVLDSETRLEVLCTIHTLLQIQDCNTHPILTMEEDSRCEVGLAKIGNGIFVAIGSYFNHSCAPNTCRVNSGDRTLLLATRNIKAGDEIGDIYSMHYSETPLDKRQKWLSVSFFFDCACKACTGAWPTYEEMDGKVTDGDLLADLRQTEQGIRLALKSGNVEAALRLHIKDVEMVEKRLKEPHRIYVSLRNSMQFCMWRKYGKIK
jgi:O6-methylguanine-DNA--protein-cysteine methyltransferase